MKTCSQGEQIVIDQGHETGTWVGMWQVAALPLHYRFNGGG